MPRNWFPLAVLPSACLFILGSASIPQKAENPKLTKLELAGKAIFHDKTLSEPAGMACVTCHDPEAGFSYPISAINQFYGTVPGVNPRRFGDRRPPSAAYAPYGIAGTPHYDADAIAYVGGIFWDGRAGDAVTQAKAPFLNKVEMNNSSKRAVIDKIRKSSSGQAMIDAYGKDLFSKPPEKVYELVARAIVAYEKSEEVSPFTSKYDAYLEGKAELTSEELLGLRLATGTMNGRPDGLPFRKSAHCADCHGLSDDWRKSRDLWTNGCYANLGVPRNRWSPAAPKEDLGLGGVLYPILGLSPGGAEMRDPFAINGTFKAPTLRNVDKRPYPGFVKAYMHNGALKSLREVVHFYNTRNLTTVPGEVIDFTEPDPYANLKGTPIWARPEYLSGWTLVNPTGKAVGINGANMGAGANNLLDPDAQQIGNLMLSDFQEQAIVAFLKTLTDGYYKR